MSPTTKKEVIMANEIIIAYETRYNSTREMAEKIGEVLAECGLGVDVLSIDQISGLGPYKAVILGSAVFTGSWCEEAAKFLETNEKTLSEKVVWLFSSGPLGEGTVEDDSKGWRFPKKLQPIADRIAPRDIALFHGKIDKDKLSFKHKFMTKVAKVPAGDFRRWDEISAWAKGIAETLKKEGVGQG